MKCSIGNCQRSAIARGFCGMHVQRFYKHGDASVTLTNRGHDGVCSVDGCERSYYGNGYCRRHNDRLYAHGSPTLADEMSERQGGVCAICGREPSGRGHESRLHLDHDHATGRWRAMLCGPCNKALGLFDDDEQRIENALAYLREWRGVAA